MAENLAAMISNVRDWSNRDSDQLTDSVITQCLRFAEDSAYRDLMIPPLENTTQALLVGEGTTISDLGTIPNTIPVVMIGRGGGQINAVEREARIPVPGDLTSFIHIRIQGSAILDDNEHVTLDPSTNELITRSTSNRRFGIVFNEKTDVRTFHDLTAEKTNSNYWTRQGNNILLNGFVGHLDVIEIFYYRRLAALGSRYIPPLMSGSTTVSTLTDTQIGTDSRFILGTVPTSEVMSLNTFNIQYTSADGTMFYGEEVPNWLINENEKVILFGALWQAFDYLQDTALSQQYLAKFQVAIEELNREERTRRASGGNVQVNFNGRGLI